ncbi:MAG: hypothetical protein HYV09_24845 [Deltaproteobacteria bacterium]|nr:hypothetical protein [Deltaproteobacteria bacterium]
MFDRTKGILLAVHDEEGDWQFLCGGEHPEGDHPRVVGLNHVTEADPSIREVMDMPPGWLAERTAVGAEWTRTRLGS